MTNSCTITQTEHKKQIDALYSYWLFLENADRNYDFKAAGKARAEYINAKNFYEAWWGQSCTIT